MCVIKSSLQIWDNLPCYCQSTTETLTSTYFRDFEFGVDQCEPDNLRDFDVLLDDNIYVINGTATYYIGIVTFITIFLSMLLTLRRNAFVLFLLPYLRWTTLLKIDASMMWLTTVQ